MTQNELKLLVKECINDILAEEQTGSDITKDPRVAAANKISAAAEVKVADEENRYYTDQIRNASREERTADPENRDAIRQKIADYKKKQAAAKAKKLAANLKKSQASSAK